MITDFKCSAPWQGVMINPDGDFRVCCAGKSLGNLNKTSIENIVNGETLRTVRNDILTKGHSTYCTNCMESEEKSGKSLREQFKQDLAEFDTNTFIPTTIDIRWRNTCQLRCGYCNSEWSSAYAQWEGKIDRVSEKDWQQNVLEYLKNNAKIDTVNMLGGEPLLLKENIELLDYIDTNITIGLVTNLSPPDIESLPVYKKLTHRKTAWLISLEAIGNKFEYIRRNATWQVTKKNYEKLSFENLDSNKGCHMTYCITSAFSLVEVFDWLCEVNPDPKMNSTFISLLLGPSKFSIYSFPPEIKLLAIKELDALSDKHIDFLNQRTKDFINSTRQSLLDTIDIWNKSDVLEFKKYVVKSDIEMSPISFAAEWPEIYNILQTIE